MISIVLMNSTLGMSNQRWLGRIAFYGFHHLLCFPPIFHLVRFFLLLLHSQDGWKATKTTRRRQTSTTVPWTAKECLTGVCASPSNTCPRRRWWLWRRRNTSGAWTRPNRPCHQSSTSKSGTTISSLLTTSSVSNK